MGSLRVKLPEPPAGKQWCTVCLSEYRVGFNIAWGVDKIEASLGPDEVRTLSGWPVGHEVPPLPDVAVSMGMFAGWYPYLGNVMYLVCHNHFTPLAFTQVSLAQGNVKDAVSAFRKQSPSGLALPG